MPQKVLPGNREWLEHAVPVVRGSMPSSDHVAKQRRKVLDRARELARSGRHADHKSIIAAVEQIEGFALARTRFQEYAFLVLQLRIMTRSIAGAASILVVRDAPIRPGKEEPSCMPAQEKRTSHEMPDRIDCDAQVRRAVHEARA